MLMSFVRRDTRFSPTTVLQAMRAGGRGGGARNKATLPAIQYQRFRDTRFSPTLPYYKQYGKAIEVALRESQGTRLYIIVTPVDNENQLTFIKFTCSRTVLPSSWCCPGGSGGESCTCHAPLSHSPGEGGPSVSVWMCPVIGQAH